MEFHCIMRLRALEFAVTTQADAQIMNIFIEKSKECLFHRITTTTIVQIISF